MYLSIVVRSSNESLDMGANWTPVDGRAGRLFRTVKPVDLTVITEFFNPGQVMTIGSKKISELVI
jgi:hypothetical protein